MTPRDEQSEPTCPRCGYDQSGEAATWDDACPIEGRCPECGHGFIWGHVFDPSRRELPWSVEASGSAFSRLMRTPRMAVRMVLPWVYWKRVGVDMAVRAGRLLSWLLCFVIAVQVLAWPFMFVLLVVRTVTKGPGTLRDLVEYYSLAGLCGIGVDAFTWPFMSVGPGWSGPWFSLFVLDDGAGRVLCFMLGVCVTWCVVLSAIPTTRRIAKLRPGHIVRAAVLNIAIVIPLFALIRIGLLAEGLSWGYPMRQVIMLAAFASVIWMLAWWVSALRAGWWRCSLRIRCGMCFSTEATRACLRRRNRPASDSVQPAHAHGADRCRSKDGPWPHWRPVF